MQKRNSLAVVARNRNGGPMRHRNQPRGGQRNEQADLLEEHAEELEELQEDPGYAQLLNRVR